MRRLLVVPLNEIREENQVSWLVCTFSRLFSAQKKTAWQAEMQHDSDTESSYALFHTHIMSHNCVEFIQ